MEPKTSEIGQVLRELENPIFLHLRVNHFPIILVFVAAAGVLLALATKKEGVWRYALVTALLAGLTAPLAYWTGTRADDTASESEVLDLERMGAHEDSAVWALVALLAAGLLAGICLVKPVPALRWLTTIAVLVAAALTAYTGAQAGHIAHGDYTMKILDK